MKVLLTGGTGFIGSHTAVAMIEAGHDIVIADNLCNSSAKVLDRIQDITGIRPEFYECDVMDQSAVRTIFRENVIDAVVHFAGLKAVEESVRQPLQYYRSNLDAALTVFEVMAEHGVKNFVFSSSATVYGEACPYPYLEDTKTGLCASPYGWTKSMIEQILTDAAAADPALSVVMLRYFNVIGAHENGLIGEAPQGTPNNLMPYLLQVAAGKRDHLTVFGGDYDKSEDIASKISDYFLEAFGEELIVNRNEMQTIPLHVGKAPDKKAYTMDQHDEYYKLVDNLPKLQDQGDGMRSFASVLLDTFTSDYSVTLIDEPEAFLHPPQARLLGKMLAHHNPKSRQLFIATHSEDFLQGLLNADNENVTVIRIDRHENTNRMSVLENEKIKDLWGNPILKYSNILSGLFHYKVVVCESDYDCLFYQAVMDAIYERDNDIAPDILFTHCGGKNRIKDVVKALKAVNVSVVAITDFDILDSSRTMKFITGAFGMDWDNQLKDEMKVIHDSINAQGSNKTVYWATIKKTGKAGLSGEAPAAYEQVELKCKAAGLFIVPVGEMECFDKTVNKEKKEWVYHILENYDLGIEAKLEAARSFIMEIATYE